ncbi:MAG: L,D-transpeptidase family protein [Betaproteobacteria bacterium]|nr:L,D-transpeptidase family protein [Betaproteobacteria bacterium]
MSVPTLPRRTAPGALRSLSSPCRRSLQRLVGLSATLLAALAGLTPAGTALASPRHPPHRAAAHPALSAEARLLDIYRLIGTGNLKAALARADALVADVPNFRLAYLVRGDVLMALSHPLTEFGDVRASGLAVPAPTPAPQASAAGPAREGINPNLVLQPPTVGELRDEALQRVRALRERPAPDAVPQAFVDLAPITRNALLVDLSRSRLYQYQQQRDGQLRLVADYYVTQGRLGADKQREGDLKTPLGIYYVTSNIDRRRLDSFYGAGALTINFPNEYDKRHNRSGSGIWLHGVPAGAAGTYARVPRASDGCVVLSNPDLQKLMSSIRPGETPIVIMRKAVWLDRAAWQRQRAAFRGLFDRWVDAREHPQAGALRGFYGPTFNSYGEPFGPWFAKAYAQPVTTPPQHATLLYDPDDKLLVATFYDVQQAGRRTVLTRRRQYWSDTGGQWKIFFEGALGI